MGSREYGEATNLDYETDSEKEVNPREEVYHLEPIYNEPPESELRFDVEGVDPSAFNYNKRKPVIEVERAIITRYGEYGEATNLDYEKDCENDYEQDVLHEEEYEVEQQTQYKMVYAPPPAMAVCPAALRYDHKEAHAEVEYTNLVCEPVVKPMAHISTDTEYFTAVLEGHRDRDTLSRLEDLKNKFGYSTEKVNKKGKNEKGEYSWGPLQLAAAFGELDTVNELCQYTLIDLAQKDNDGDTPLHAAAYWDHDSTIDILLNTAKNPVKARLAINMSNKADETPFTFAATRYHTKSCAMMIRYSPPLTYTFNFVHPGRNPGTQDMEKETDSGRFGKLRTKEAVKNVEKMNEHIIKYHKPNGQGKTSINIMITKMPELVFEILDKSIIRTKTTILTESSKGSENKHEDIQRVIVDFGALENYGEKEEEEEEEPNNSEVLGKEDEKKPFVTVNVEEKEEEKKTKKEKERDKKEEEETGKPLTSGYYKHGSNPLQIMAKMNHNLLTHPVVEALIVTKWEKFARTYFYIFTFLLYLIFFSVLMGYQFTQIKPFELLENDKAIRSWIENSSHTCDEFPDGCSKEKSAESDIFGYILLVMSAIRLFLELLDLLDNVFFNGSDLDSGSNSPLETGKAWLQGLMNYLIDPENYLEVILYGSCLFFSLNVLEPQSVMSPFHWKIGSLSVLTSFINLLLILQVFPNIGIYIIMFFKIAWTFLSKILSLLVFFLIAFMVVFHMLLSHTNVFRNILSADAIFKTLSAGVSGVEYDDYADQEMIYPTTTLVGLIAFALFVQVLFLNLATALAIGDVDAIRSGAEKAKNALKIKHIYNAQRIVNLIQWVATPIFCGNALNVLEHQKRFRNMPAKRFKEDRLAYIETCTEKYTEAEKSEICTKECTGKCTEKSENVVIPFSDFYKKHYKGE
ncbi:transient receptor potential cation channel subfamily A member 1-like [Bolinopsis microptera]|uniref:transient receptor potential cation channel subfamily A member 1-like n=1 Tax=Bolinopsis microptera TaxID=2820187 RepID=UPI003078CF92